MVGYCVRVCASLRFFLANSDFARFRFYGREHAIRGGAGGRVHLAVCEVELVHPDEAARVAERLDLVLSRHHPLAPQPQRHGLRGWVLPRCAVCGWAVCSGGVLLGEVFGGKRPHSPLTGRGVRCFVVCFIVLRHYRSVFFWLWLWRPPPREAVA